MERLQLALATDERQTSARSVGARACYRLRPRALLAERAELRARLHPESRDEDASGALIYERDVRAAARGDVRSHEGGIEILTERVDRERALRPAHGVIEQARTGEPRGRAGGEVDVLLVEPLARREGPVGM